jgi:hypothetical protein
MAKRQAAATARNRALDERLRAYGAGLSAASGNIRRHTGNWPIYAAATGSALAMATGASASLITSGIQSSVFQSNVSVKAQGSSVNSSHWIQMGSGHKINLKAVSNGTFAVLGLQPGPRMNLFFTGSSSAKNFRFQSNIGGSHAAPQAEIVKAMFSGQLIGKFQSGQPGFAGFSITSASHVNTEYGWLELVFTEKSGTPSALRALAYGIDTNPNEVIQAGQINGGFIPEPGTMSLAILAAGACGVMALRRRRLAGQAAGQAE